MVSAEKQTVAGEYRSWHAVIIEHARYDQSMSEVADELLCFQLMADRKKVTHKSTRAVGVLDRVILC